MGVPPWIIGATVNVVGSLAINLGTNVIKLSHDKAEVINERRRDSVSAYQSKWFFIGLFLFVTGNVLNFVSMGYTAQILLSALGSVQFISNVVFARLVLHEKITLRVILGTLLILIGNACIVVYSNHDSKKYKLKTLLSLFVEERYITYLLVALSVSVALHSAYLCMQRRQGNPETFSAHFLMPCAYAVVSALIGTQSVVLAKALSSLFRSTLERDLNMFWSLPAYGIASGYLLTMCFWVLRLNYALQKFDALFMVPCMQVLWTVCSIVSCGIYFDEFLVMSQHSLFMFVLGICIVLVGVTVIAPTTTTDVVDDRAIADTESVTKFSRRPTLSIGGYAFSIWTLVSHDVTPDNEYQLIRSKSKLQQPPQTTENTPLIAPVTVMGLPLNPLPDPVTMRTVNVDLAHLGSV